MHRGYVKLWRCIEDTGLVGQPSAFYLYSYLLLKATHKSKSVVVSGAVFSLEAGQVVVGRNKLADDTGLSVRQIRTALELLKKLSLIATKATNKCTVVSIVNWDAYQNNQPELDQQNDQQSGQHPTSARPAPDQRPTTIQECKNIRTEEDNNTPLTPQRGERGRARRAPSPDSIPALTTAVEEYTSDDGLREALLAFIAMRTKIRKPLTGRALQISMRKLDELAGDDVQLKIRIIDQSVQRSWQGLFQLRDDGFQKQNSGDDLLAHIDAARREAREAAERHARENSPWRRS